MRPLLLALLLLACASPLQALETDQFTLSPTPLIDSGESLSARIIAALADVLSLQDRYALDEERIAAEFHHRLGKGALKSELERFVDKDLPEDARFLPPLGSSIYRGVMLPIPGGLIVRAPTVRVFGYELGTDKLGHFIQQGYEYYRIYQRTPGPEGVRHAVDHGVRQEHTYFGTAVSGVYSNADLVANLAGLKFYLNLTQRVEIGDVTLEPILVRRGQTWELSPHVNAQALLQPYVSEHWSEALNPSEYRMIHLLVAGAVRQRCETWQARLGTAFDASYFTARISEYSTWGGEDYGHRYDPRYGISLANQCFGDEVVQASPGRTDVRTTLLSPLAKLIRHS